MQHVRTHQNINTVLMAVMLWLSLLHTHTHTRTESISTVGLKVHYLMKIAKTVDNLMKLSLCTHQCLALAPSIFTTSLPKIGVSVRGLVMQKTFPVFLRSTLFYFIHSCVVPQYGYWRDCVFIRILI
jgi:hypothetical protein